ncbi:hypothetical protein [Bacteriovorax sp. Seq25_V]|uniref:hypothetical protein n=1 Tax=Bacteriovorax sp. Seq25_V TaxID=1201288 RepID=UPI00038A0035|nr:hypothetical protein [Bacteriovorax sp. Seq25_V]EQC48071.1 hypothetical protein M900_1130 [Bacteriovorax sp. Seq25_V]
MNKFLLLLIFSISIFAKTDISLNSDGAEKYFTPLEMKQALTWKIYFSGDKKDGVSKVLPMKLYETKDLNGKVIGEINEKGLFFKGKKICHFEKVHGGLNLLIDERPLKNDDWDVVKSYGMNTKHLCESYPLRRGLYASKSLEQSEYEMEVIVSDGKVGTYDHEGTSYYFKIDHMEKEASRIEKDTETILKEKLSDDEMKALNKSLVELRRFLKTATLEQLYERVLNGRDGNDVLVHKRIFTFKTKKDFFNKLKNKHNDIIKNAIKLTYLSFAHFDKGSYGINTDDNLAFGITGKELSVSYALVGREWKISQLIALSYLK